MKTPTENKIACKAKLFSWGDPASYTRAYDAVLHQFEHQVAPGITIRYGVADVACDGDEFGELSQPSLTFEFPDGRTEVAHVLQYQWEAAVSVDFGGQGGEGPRHLFSYCVATCGIGEFTPPVR